MSCCEELRRQHAKHLAHFLAPSKFPRSEGTLEIDRPACKDESSKRKKGGKEGTEGGRKEGRAPNGERSFILGG